MESIDFSARLIALEAAVEAMFKVASEYPHVRQEVAIALGVQGRTALGTRVAGWTEGEKDCIAQALDRFARALEPIG